MDESENGVFAFVARTEKTELYKNHEVFFFVTCPVRFETNDTADDVVPQMLRLLSGLTSVQVNVTSYNLQTDGNDADRSFLRLGMAHTESILDTKTPFSDLSRLIRT